MSLPSRSVLRTNHPSSLPSPANRPNEGTSTRSGMLFQSYFAARQAGDPNTIAKAARKCQEEDRRNDSVVRAIAGIFEPNIDTLAVATGRDSVMVFEAITGNQLDPGLARFLNREPATIELARTATSLDYVERLNGNATQEFCTRFSAAFDVGVNMRTFRDRGVVAWAAFSGIQHDPQTIELLEQLEVLHRRERAEIIDAFLETVLEDHPPAYPFALALRRELDRSLTTARR